MEKPKFSIPEEEQQNLILLLGNDGKELKKLVNQVTKIQKVLKLFCNFNALRYKRLPMFETLEIVKIILNILARCNQNTPLQASNDSRQEKKQK